jgi:hypothetical protein
MKDVGNISGNEIGTLPFDAIKQKVGGGCGCGLSIKKGILGGECGCGKKMKPSMKLSLLSIKAGKNNLNVDDFINKFLQGEYRNSSSSA